MSWQEKLGDLFSATVNQQTLEEAVDLMLSVSKNDREYHDECESTLQSAIDACETNHDEVIAEINKSGYQVKNALEAKKLLQDFLAIYLNEYNKE